MRGYDSIAPFYDDLSGIVFGKPMLDAQVVYFTSIPPGARVLLLGGGTGWVMEVLLKMNPRCRIYYIDVSEKMQVLARKRTKNDPRIVFIRGTENDIPSAMFFDVIITHFYLDIFGTGLPDKIQAIAQHLSLGGLWLVTNFVETGKLRHRFIYAGMKTFFSWVSGYRQKKLMDWSPAFLQHHFIQTEESFFYDGFIRADVWKKI